MEARLRELLKRLGQADSVLRDRGDQPEPFLLIYAMQGSIGIKHPAWDSSWSEPTAEDIDDLSELGLVRLQDPGNVKRIFSLTVQGRSEANLLSTPAPQYPGGSAPPLTEVLTWLVAQERAAPEGLDLPSRLLDRAVASGFIGADGRGALARSIVRLAGEGYLDGFLPDLQQATDEQRLQLAEGLTLTMKAHQERSENSSQSSDVNFYGPVVAAQVAGRDISNYVNFTQLLSIAEQTIRDLDGVDDDAQREALTLIDLMRGKAADLSGQVLTGAGGGLLAQVLSQLLGISAQ